MLDTKRRARRKNGINETRNQLFVLLACVFVVMIGFGITLPVLPFYVERLAAEGGASRQTIVMHVGLLTGIYPLVQLIFAPLWGRWSDRIGRRPLVLIGIAGYVVAQVMFGLANSLWLLYAARVIGGMLSSATLPVAAAYVADMTREEERGRGMAWFGTAVSLGVVVGPALGGMLSRRDWHFNWSYGHFMVDSFSTPFFAAAFLGLLTLFAAIRWLAESLHSREALVSKGEMTRDWRTLVKSLRPLLALALAGQLALTIFEGTSPSMRRRCLTPTAKPPPVAVRKTKALPCAGIDLRVAKISPLPWACQVQKERRDRNERMAKPISREVVLPVPRGDRTEVSKEINVWSDPT